MNTPKQPKKAKARVMYYSGCANPFAGMRQDKNEFYTEPVVAIPCATPTQARHRARFENLSDEEKVERVAKALSAPVEHGIFSFSFARVHPDVVKSFARAALKEAGLIA